MTTTKDSARSNLPILQGKSAVVFGAGGSIGSAVAKEFAAEGAEVFLAGRTRSNLELVAEKITEAGGKAHAAVIDALNDGAVNEYIDGIVKQAGKIDILLDAAGPLRESTATERLPWNCRLKSSWCR